MESFTKDGVVPDVIDETPPAQLRIVFEGGLEVTPGLVLKPTQVKDVPTVEYEAEEGAYYTLVMNDPDAPSRADPKWGEWHHWLVTNIPGAEVTKGVSSSEYIGSGPPEGTGLHRYVFLLFKQPGKLEFAGLPQLTNRSMDKRNNQKVRDFASKYNLGKPIAGNFYFAEFDDYVPLLYKQLSGET